uniref:Stigma-specific STIG1-like protein 1 n=1 Tax=Ananas comosus var. bracteatus TaxID=296719 RepID=A0A6V7PV92_ANACO|nr:unnamed protein product [Ananas comosus var. bracteatus]
MKLILILALLFIVLATALCNDDNNKFKDEPHQTNRSPLIANDLTRNQNSSLKSMNLRGPLSCNVFPRVCRGLSSPGLDCCSGRCVNVDTNLLNCGQCGRRCRYGETCCGGRCVNVMFDPLNCGGCKNKCMQGSSCRYGMCSYA